jgi:IS30 family transposase
MAKHIDLAERRAIERALNSGNGVNEIARMRKRSKSTISEEIRAGSVKGIYKAQRAQKKADLRRKQSKQRCLKVALDPTLKEYVTAYIKEDQSPEAISGRIRKVDTHLPYASPKAIYHFVHSGHGGPIEHRLYRKRVHRTGGPKRGTIRATDTTKRSIEERPKRVGERMEFGHFEGDFIVSGKDGHDALLVLVERKTRMPFLARVTDRSTSHVNKLIERMLHSVPVLSVTLDNDISFAKHEALSELIDATVYYTHPYTSQDKGTVENRNGRIREFIPKRSDISQVPDDVILRAEEHLRTRFMKCLEWRSPQEVWDKEVGLWKQRVARARVRKNAQCAVSGLLN